MTEPRRGQQLDLVVAEDGVYLASVAAGAGLQPHRQIEHAHAVRAPIDHIAEQDQSVAAGAPLVIETDDVGRPQELPQLVQVPVDVAEDKQARHGRRL